MIGVIGPEDSVELAQRVAKVDGTEELAVRAYRQIEQTVELARELDHACNVLLFTGRVPYALARRAGNLRAVLDFIPHSGVDLYRTLVQILRQRRGVIPELSIDTIEPSEVAQSFEDLDLPAPRHVFCMDEGATGLAPPIAEHIAAYHRERLAAGEVEVALTCVGSTHQLLLDQDLPCWRIEHTRSAVRESLRRAHLASLLARSESTQSAIALVEVPALTGPNVNSEAFYEAQRLRLRAHESLLTFAERLRGTLSLLDERMFIVHTTRGAVEDAIFRFRRGQRSPLDTEALPVPVVVGYGVGFSVTGAEENARRALAMTQRSGVPHVLFADGTVFRCEWASATRADQALGEVEVRRESGALGLGDLATARLLTALRRLDPSAVTARDLAERYGVQARSARRLLAQLEAVGVAQPLDGRQPVGRGRPQKIYRVDLDRLLRLTAGGFVTGVPDGSDD